MRTEPSKQGFSVNMNTQDMFYHYFLGRLQRRTAAGFGAS